MQPQERRQRFPDGNILFGLLHLDREPLGQARDEVAVITEVLVKQFGGVTFHLARRNGLLVECGAAKNTNELRRTAETANIPRVFLVELCQRRLIVRERGGVVDVAEPAQSGVAGAAAGPKVTVGIQTDVCDARAAVVVLAGALGHIPLAGVETEELLAQIGAKQLDVA